MGNLPELTMRPALAPSKHSKAQSTYALALRLKRLETLKDAADILADRSSAVPWRGVARRGAFLRLRAAHVRPFNSVGQRAICRRNLKLILRLAG